MRTSLAAFVVAGLASGTNAGFVEILDLLPTGVDALGAVSDLDEDGDLDLAVASGNSMGTNFATRSSSGAEASALGAAPTVKVTQAGAPKGTHDPGRGQIDPRAAGPAASGDGNIIIHELVSDFSWGYRFGVKQPLGAYKSGLSVHQITKSDYQPGTEGNPFPASTEGNPDYLFWVDEENESFGVSEMPTDEFHDFCTNPGGMVSFSDDGTVWYAYAARSTCLPIDLYSSLRPYDTNAFLKRVDDVDLARGSTTPCINVHDPNLMLFWRHKNAGNRNVSISLRRYDINGDFQLPEFEIELVHGEPHPDLETVGIEQLWTRFDPRLNYTLIAWHFKTTTDPAIFGSDSMLYSDDDGTTWRKADGSPVLDLPVQYSDVDDVLTPVDHLAQGSSIGWLVNDVGVSSNGTFWMTLPGSNNSTLTFWFFNGTTWEPRLLAQIPIGKPHACGVTKDLIVFAYSDSTDRHVLKARLSEDDGRSWSEPIILDTLDTSLKISWVSFVQPADNYTDNSARFFYGYAQASDGVLGLRYQNNIRWIKFIPDIPLVGDLDGDGQVGVSDLLILLASWGTCEDCSDCPADLDGDCSVGTSDLLILLSNWG